MCMYVCLSADEPILSFQRSAFYHLREERKLLKYQDSSQPNNFRLAIDLLFHEVSEDILLNLPFHLVVECFYS